MAICRGRFEGCPYVEEVDGGVEVPYVGDQEVPYVDDVDAEDDDAWAYGDGEPEGPGEFVERFANVVEGEVDAFTYAEVEVEVIGAVVDTHSQA